MIGRKSFSNEAAYIHIHTHTEEAAYIHIHTHTYIHTMYQETMIVRESFISNSAIQQLSNSVFQKLSNSVI